MAPVDPDKGIPIKYVNYAQFLANGYEYHDAWRRSGLGTYSKSKAIRVANHPEVVSIIREVRESVDRAQVMTLQEKRSFLAKVVRTPIGELTEHSIYAKEFKRSSNICFEVKGQDKLKAIELDSKLAGDFDKDGGGGSGGVMAEFIARIRDTRSV